MTSKGKRQAAGAVVLAVLIGAGAWALWLRPKALPPAPASRPDKGKAAIQPIDVDESDKGGDEADDKKEPATRPAMKDTVTAQQAAEAYQHGVRLHEEGKKILAANGPKHEAETNMLNARTDLSLALLSGHLQGEQEADARARTTELAEWSILSPTVVNGDPYTGWHTFTAGEVLQRTERGLKLQVPTQILLRINALKDARAIRAGQQIKILRGPCHAIVNKGSFTLDLYLQRDDLPKVFVKRLRVGLGKNGSTPVGMWRVALGKKMMHAPWNPPPNAPKQGKILFGEPDYPLGTMGYWISLEGVDDNTRSALGYGIHGTNEPDSIGKAESLGCIRLADPDIELVFSLLYEKWSSVEIRP